MKEAALFWSACGTWLLPFTAGRVFENVFASGYTGVNIGVFVATPACALAAGWCGVFASARVRGIVSLLAEVLILPVLGGKYGTGSESSFWLYLVCCLSGVSMGVSFVTAFSHVLGVEKEVRRKFETGIVVSAIPVALLTDMLIAELAFTTHDTYFTQTEQAFTKILIVYLCLIVVNTALKVPITLALPTESVHPCNPCKFKAWTHVIAASLLIAI